jgi:glycosyltransferase involved in cell wall biosynthesis
MNGGRSGQMRNREATMTVTGVLFANRLASPLQSMTGVGRYFHSLTRELWRLPERPGWTYDLSTPAEKIQPHWLPAGMRHRRVPAPRKMLNTAWTGLGWPRLERLIGDFDFVHALYPSFPVPTQRVAVLTIHDLLPMRRPEWYSPYVRWGFRRTVERAAARGWEMIVDSEHVAGQLLELGTIDPRRITVIPLGVSDEFRQAVPTGQRLEVARRLGIPPAGYLLAVGSISLRKNLLTVIRAVARADPAIPPLILAGSPDTSASEVHVEIDRLGLHHRVRPVGFVADEHLPALVQGARALLHPSFDEGFGLPPLEAMAAGTPVVASRAGSLPEIVGEAGLLVDPTDIDEWASAISTVVTDDDHRQTLIDAGRIRAARFTWHQTAQQTHAVHARVVGLA